MPSPASALWLCSQLRRRQRLRQCGRESAARLNFPGWSADADAGAEPGADTSRPTRAAHLALAHAMWNLRRCWPVSMESQNHPPSGPHLYGTRGSSPVLLFFMVLMIGPPSSVTVLNFDFGGSSIDGRKRGSFSAHRYATHSTHKHGSESGPGGGGWCPRNYSAACGAGW